MRQKEIEGKRLDFLAHSSFRYGIIFILYLQLQLHFLNIKEKGINQNEIISWQ